MIRENDLPDILQEALIQLHNRGTIIQVCRWVWDNYENELRQSGDLFYTWQYQIRWAATVLRHRGIMKNANESPRGLWELNE
jgi:hypothetical protein